MSELAGEYYAARPIVGGPDLLQGGRKQLLAAADYPVATALGRNFNEIVAPVAEFAMEGVPDVMGEYGMFPSTEEWTNMKQRMASNGGYAPLSRFARRNVVPALARDFPDLGTAYIEALARSEVPAKAFATTMRNTGATGFDPSPLDPEQQHSQVYLLSRTLSDEGRCVNAHLTVVWGELRRPPHKYDYLLSVRYLGAALTPLEIDERPWLHEPQ